MLPQRGHISSSVCAGAGAGFSMTEAAASISSTLLKALEQQGFVSEGKNMTCTKYWVEHEKEQLAEVMKGYGIEWEKLGTHEQHLDVLDYKKKMRAREVAALESEVAGVQRQLESRQMILNDADNAIERLDKEYAEKSYAVEKVEADLEAKSAELESTTEQLTINQQLLQVTSVKVAQISDIDSISVKRSMLGDKVTLSEMDYNSIVELAKKELAAEHDTAAKDDEIYRLNEILQALNKEKALWTDERSGLHKTIDKLRAQVRGLTDQLSALKAKYDRVMEFIEKFDLKEKLDNFLHPIGNIKKHRR